MTHKTNKKTSANNHADKIIFRDTYGILKLSGKEDPRTLLEIGDLKDELCMNGNNFKSRGATRFLEEIYLFDYLWEDPFDFIYKNIKEPECV